MSTYYQRNKEKARAAARRRYHEKGGYAGLSQEQKFKDRRAKHVRTAYRRDVTNRPWKLLHTFARKRAKMSGKEFTITVDDVKSIWTDVCPILNIPLYKSDIENKHCDNSHSLDRIDSTKGYIPGNVAIISRRANVIKNNGSADEHRLIAEWMDKHSLAAGDPS